MLPALPTLLVSLQLSPVAVAMEGIDGEGGSPVLTQRMVSPGGGLQDTPRCDLSHSQIEPEYEAHSPQLSPLGREQVGVGVCAGCGCGVCVQGVRVWGVCAGSRWAWGVCAGCGVWGVCAGCGVGCMCRVWGVGCGVCVQGVVFKSRLTVVAHSDVSLGST